MKINQPRKTKWFIGSKFGKLTVLDFSHYAEPKTSVNSKTGRKAWWKCKCECGNEVLVENSNLSYGQTSCGCAHKERIDKLHKSAIKPDAPFYAVLADYKRGALDRCFSWELSEEQFRQITSSNCHYCNDAPSKVKDRNGNAVYRGTPYVYNGIDRVDNKLGYTVDNIVPCCWMCNMLKGTFGKDEFINKIKQIAEWQASPAIKAELSTGLKK